MNGPAVDPQSPPSIQPSLAFMCDTLVARGDDVMWCLRPFEGPSQEGDRIRAITPGLDTPLVSQDVFFISDIPDSAGVLNGRAATDGNNLFFATAASDGTGNIVSTLFALRYDPSAGTFTTEVLACDLPEIVDITVGNSYVYFAAFEPETDKVDRNGIFRVAY